MAGNNSNENQQRRMSLPAEKHRLKQSPHLFYGWVILATAFIIMVVGYPVRNTFSVFYPTIVEEFGWERGSTALMFSITVLIYGLTAPLAGHLVDRFGPRVVLPAGACLMGTGLALCSLAQTQWQFYLFYGVITAAGLSLTGWTPLTAIVSRWFIKKRGLAFSVLAAGFGSSMLSATLAQFLISNFNWRMAYIIIAIIPVVIIVPLSAIFMRRSPQEKGLLPDGAGAKHQPPETQIETTHPAVPKESSNPDDQTLRQALKNRRFWLLFFTGFCFIGITEYAILTHQVYFFRDVGYDPMMAAAFFSLFGIMFVIGKFLGSLSNRLGTRNFFIWSCLVGMGAVCLLFFIKDTSHPWMAFLFVVLFGIGFGPTAPVFFTRVAGLFQGKHFGSIQGFTVLGISLGGTLAPWLAGFLHDQTGSYFITFWIILGSLAVSCVLMWFTKY